MRLLLTTDCVGGVWTFTEELSRGLLRAGHAVGLVSLGRLPSQAQRRVVDGFAEEFGQSFAYLASEAPLEWMDGNERAWEDGSAAVMKMMYGFEPEVIHSSQFCFGQLETGLPVLVTAHSDVLSWAEACLGERGVARLEATSLRCWLERYRKLVGEGLSGADRVTAPTQWMADGLERMYGLKQKVGVIANGRTLTGVDAGERRLQAVTAGRIWDQAKGLEVLREVESPMPILLAGESEFNGNVMEGLPARVTPLGALESEALLRVFAESSVYLATSVYEPFGLAPLEAALCGCAVVARGIAPLREVWGDGAIYVEDAAGLTGLLRRLAESGTELAEARARSLARARRFSAERMVEDYLQEYDTLLMRSGMGEYAHDEGEDQLA